MKAREVNQTRKRLGLSKKKFAKVVGVSRMTVFRWETGRSKPMPLARAKIKKLMSNTRVKRK